MRFSVVVTGLFAAVASAQSATETASNTDTVVSSASSAASGGDSTTVPASTTNTVASLTSVSIDPAQTSAQAAILQCINACSPDDVNCQAKCIAVPSPDNSNVNKTTECVAACPQGNGTAADNLDYANCVNGCIAQYYYTSTGTPNLATTSGSGSGSSATPSVTQIQSTVTSDGSTFVTSFSSTVAPSESGSADSASTSSSSAGADMLFSPVGTGFGLFSFLAAFLAL
ncbi:hypothetical protein F5Y13DRAFT_174750 [Hypoxylon sp. FL1857]|nr:hypothetical protein F5Y13DRAFT_174750 [Hypoxylon sp. FL1857]